MSDTAYRLGFTTKLAEMNKSALSSIAGAAMREYSKDQDKKLGYRPKIRKTYRPTFRGTLSQIKDRTKDHLGSLGRGVTSAAGVTGLRALQGATELATWVPGMVDSLLFGKLMGIDEGRGILGRGLGKFNRAIDSRVHALRNWTDRYDYEHNVGSGFNRFLNGVAADATGKFIGLGGLGGLTAKTIGGKALGGVFGTLGATSALTGSDQELRARENEIRQMHPRNWGWIDATSTATNQKNAPNLEEYKRYHTPVIPNLSTSVTGYIDIPRRWWFDSWGAPIQTLDFGN